MYADVAHMWIVLMYMKEIFYNLTTKDLKDLKNINNYIIKYFYYIWLFIITMWIDEIKFQRYGEY